MQEGKWTEKARLVLKKYDLTPDKVGHSYAVAEVASRIAERMNKEGIKVDIDVVQAASIIHEIGLVKTPTKTEKEEMDNPQPEHAVYGGQLALEESFPELVATCIQNHDVDFSADEAKELGLPPAAVGMDWKSDTWEARVVMYADQIVAYVRGADADPWSDHDIVNRGNFDYLMKIYKYRLNKDISRDHPIMKRMEWLNSKMIKYVKPEDVPPPWDGISKFELK